MKNPILLVVLIFLSLYAQAQIQITNPATFNTAGQGDLYIDNDSIYYIGLRDGSLKEIGNIVAKGTTDGQVLIWDNTLEKWEVGNDGFGWKLQGNTGTDDTVNYLGTTDANKIVFKTNDEERMVVGQGTNSFQNLSLSGPINQQSYSGTTTMLGMDLNLGEDGQAAEAVTMTGEVNGVSNQFIVKSGSSVSGDVNLYKNRIWHINGAAPITNARGFYMDHRLEGSNADITNLSFLEFNFRNQRVGGSVTNYYGLRHRFLNPTDMSTTNFYGVHNESMTSTNISNYYGFYQGNLGVAANRYAFYYDGDDTNTQDVVITGTGKIGIGTNTPLESLDVATGNVRLRDYPNTRNDAGSQSVTNILYTDANGNVLSAPVSEIFGAATVETKTGNYTLTLADNNKIIEFDSATDVVCTVPTNLPPGYQVSITQMGIGRVRFVGGATVLNAYNSFKTARQYSKAGVEIASTGDAIISGDVAK